VDLFPDEKLEIDSSEPACTIPVVDEQVDGKYIAGEIRIVTEQARYPLPSIPAMVESNDYNLNPDFQRRHRWDPAKQSRLIESFIMNVPIPPIFLYEDQFSHYEVMDGLQRLTAINDFYKDRLVLEGLEEWAELNGRKYSNLPEQLRRGVDRRYLSSVILLQETAKNPTEAQRLKQLVFERINSGGVQLEPQESRNAIYDGPLNRLCIKLARTQALCATWNIPLPTASEEETGEVSKELLQNSLYQKMTDVELVLRFFAYRQRLAQRGSLKEYLDNYLRLGNLFPKHVLEALEDLFVRTINLIYQTLGPTAFWLLRKRQKGNWLLYKRPTYVVYDPLMYAFSGYVNHAAKVQAASKVIKQSLENIYKKKFAEFEGRYTNFSDMENRNQIFLTLLADTVGLVDGSDS